MKKWISLIVILLVPAVLFAQGDDGGGNNTLEIILGFVSVVMTAVSAFLGRAWNQIKRKLGKAMVLLTEATDVATLATETGNEINQALEDNKLEPDELTRITAKFKRFPQELAQVKAAFKSLLSKE